MRSLTSSTWDGLELEAVLRVAASGQTTMGPEVAEFEREYAAFCGTRYCVAVNSGSSANLVMVAAFTLRRGGPGTVIVPTVGWATSYSPFQQYGWRLVFVDIDRETLNYDTRQLRAACRKYQPDCILAVNLLGNPNDFDEFPNGIQILEDNCESMGARYNGRVTGSFGEMGTHSTFFSHHICTMEGGMVTTNDEHYYQMLLSLRSHGWTRHLPEENVFSEPVEKFRFILPGYNVRPTEMQGALGRVQLRKLPGFIAQRRDNADRFPLRTQREVGESSWFGFVVFDEDRDKVIGEHETRPVVTGNFLRQPVISHYRYEVHNGTENADYIHDHALMIGNSHERIEWESLKRSTPSLLSQAADLLRSRQRQSP
jgi:CDP-6-deoxy-D-xylo-4-hexulose-3-dehydrase